MAMPHPSIDDRLRELCERQHGPDHTFSSEQIARYCGCSEEVIRQAEKRAIQKIRRRLFREGLLKEAERFLH